MTGPPAQAILFFMAQKFARLSVDEVQYGTGWAIYRVILVLSRPLLSIISVQQMVDVAISCRTGENNMSHVTLIGFCVPVTLI
jgi:hypothetical protein